MPLEFTYRAASEELPAPLPTIREIEASRSLPRRSPGSPTVYFLRPHFIIKCGKQVKMVEGDNMMFVRRHSDLCAPKLYAAFHDTDSGKNYLIMEYIAGESVSRCWDKLDKETKESVVADLRRGFDQLRGVKSPGYLGNLGGENVLVHGEEICSPIQTGYDWTEAMLAAAQRESPLPPARYEWFRKMYHRLLDNCSEPSEAVFTHADLHPENILLREGNRKPVVIDWERAGFYPPYYEYQITMVEERFATDWGTYVDRFLDPHPDQMFVLYHWRSWAMFGAFCEPPGFETEPSQYVMSYWLDHLEDTDYGSQSDESDGNADGALLTGNLVGLPQRSVEVADMLEGMDCDEE